MSETSSKTIKLASFFLHILSGQIEPTCTLRTFAELFLPEGTKRLRPAINRIVKDQDMDIPRCRHRLWHISSLMVLWHLSIFVHSIALPICLEKVNCIALHVQSLIAYLRPVNAFFYKVR